ncbi:MAG TPA: SPOR domain-containing protein [Xanthomonadaceae bacterium]|nr:SPOR domain-containing protein [Xanthomonadaceae bacterium]
MIPRILVALLVAMNLAVAIWWIVREPVPPATVPATEPGIPALRLLGELEPELPAELSAAPVADDAVESCLEIGPFRTRADLRRAFNALMPAVERIQYRETRARSERGFWVLIPAFEDRERALVTARELSARGIADYYVVTAGENENTISLGLFREQANAQERRDAVVALGFPAEIRDRTEEVPHYWIAMAAAPGFDWRARLGGYAGVEAQPIQCQ